MSPISEHQYAYHGVRKTYNLLSQLVISAFREQVRCWTVMLKVRSLILEQDTFVALSPRVDLL